MPSFPINIVIARLNAKFFNRDNYLYNTFKSLLMHSKKDIPVYNLETFSKRGIFIRNMSGNIASTRVKQAHRDENYIFIFQESGTSSLMIDFKEIKLDNRVACCIFPGQVHYEISNFESKGYLIALDSDLIPDYVRNIFDQLYSINISCEFDDGWAMKIKNTIQLLELMILNPQSEEYDFNIIKFLANALANLFAGTFDQKFQKNENSDHSETLTYQFKKLLQKEFRTIKSPKDYAGKLNISAAYLNQVVKKNTGMPLSYWIQQEIILEAKRLLFFTTYTVKEIAFNLGYEDPAYFSRLFLKLTGLTPLSFRENSRK